MKKIKITQIKSAIDRPDRQKLTLRALGLNKMNASREVEATDQILGMVRTVNHLLKVEESGVRVAQEQEPKAEMQKQEAEFNDDALRLPVSEAAVSIDEEPVQEQSIVEPALLHPAEELLTAEEPSSEEPASKEPEAELPANYDELRFPAPKTEVSSDEEPETGGSTAGTPTLEDPESNSGKRIDQE